MLARKNTDLSKILTKDSPHHFRDHEISVTIISNEKTKVTFRGVPITVPDEELLHLRSLHGDITDRIVQRDPIRLGGNARNTLTSSTSMIEIQLTQGKPLRNFYWLVGPG